MLIIDKIKIICKPIKNHYFKFNKNLKENFEILPIIICINLLVSFCKYNISV